MASRPPLPRFIIGGAPRSGTNFLCHALERHPDVYIPRPYIPEPKVFFGKPRTGEEYRALSASLFRDAGPRRALGEKTANYFESEIACARIHEHVPEVRMIFVVREPVARAYSNYLWSRKNGLETLPFEEAVELEGQRASPLPPEQWHARPFDYLCRGRYDVFARRYYERFGRDRVMFFLYETMITEPEKVLDAVQAFIDVDPRPLDVSALGVINSARETGPPIDATLNQVLRARMAPAVRDFQALTGVDVGPWGYDPPRV